MTHPLTYPNAPGYKTERPETSKAAAVKVEPRSRTLRDQCWALLQVKDYTADEVAAILKESVLTIRPRITELNKQLLIEDSGARRKNESGATAVVWRKAKPKVFVQPEMFI